MERELIGREAELARIDALLDRGSSLMLRGPRGVGISALLSAAGARARSRGMGVLRATGVQWESGFPYAGLHQLLRPLRREAEALPPLAAALAGEPVPAREVAPALVELATATDGALVRVDEWQWVDAETRAALAAFAGRDVPVALLLGGHVGGPPGIEELVVGPLDPVSSARLLGPELPLLVRERVLREAAGRPLALLELPEAYKDAGDGVLLGSWAPLTPALEEAFGDGLDRLEPDTAHAVLIAALDDGGTVPDVLAAASVSREALKPAVALGLIALDGDRLAFTHPLIRAAVRHRADPAARQAGHEAFAAVVADRDPDRAVWHRVVGSSGSDPELAGALEAASWRARDAGDYELAAAGMRRAANLGGDRSRRFAAAAQLAYELGGVDIADRLLAQAGALDALGRARAASLGPGPTDAFLAHARVAADAGDRELAARLLWLAATTERGSRGDATIVPDHGRLVDARGQEPEVLARIAQRAVVAPPEELALLGFAAFVLGDPHLAWALTAPATGRLRSQRRRTPLGPVLVLSAWARLALSELDGAQEDAEESAWLCDRTRQPVWGAAARAAKAAVLALRGDASATRLAAEAERVALPARVSPVLALVQQARGMLALADGRPGEAFAHLRRPFDARDPAFDRPWAVNLLGDLAEAATEPQERAFVAALLADVPATPAAAVSAVHARLILDEGGALADPRWPFTRARTLLALGMRLRRSRRVADSREPLREAAAIFASLGAVPWAERAQRELAATAETVQRGEEDRLTPQELEIARLAARGMTNPAIAADLALSPRTVSHHLARIFPKLDVSSRKALGDALERFGY